MLGRIHLYILVVVTLTACSNYNRVLKSDDYAQKFELANELYDKADYGKAITLYEQVYQRFSKQPEGELAYFRIGSGYYQENDFYMAGYFLGNFVQRFPFSAKVEEATFLSAMCSVANSPQPSLDQNETEIALNDLQIFIDRFPNSPRIDTCNQIMDRLRFKLEKKEYDAVKLYDQTYNYRAAVVSSEEFLKNYPTSDFAEEINYLLVYNSFYLAKNSVSSKKMERLKETLERYRTFVARYPDSRYVRTLEFVEKQTQDLIAESK